MQVLEKRTTNKNLRKWEVVKACHVPIHAVGDDDDYDILVVVMVTDLMPAFLKTMMTVEVVIE